MNDDKVDLTPNKRDPEGFIKAIVEHFFLGDGAELEYDDFLSLGNEHGILRCEIFDPKNKHKDMDFIGLEDMVEGEDVVYVENKP